MGEFRQELRYGFIEACLHLVNRDFDALSKDFVTLGWVKHMFDINVLLLWNFWAIYTNMIIIKYQSYYIEFMTIIYQPRILMFWPLPFGHKVCWWFIIHFLYSSWIIFSLLTKRKWRTKLTASAFSLINRDVYLQL